MSINDKLSKIKSFLDSSQGKSFYFIILIVLVAGSSFGLGRLSYVSQNSDQVSIIYSDGSQVANVIKSASKPAIEVGEEAGLPAKAGSNSFVASSRGKKYYPIGCSAADNLKEDNKVFFVTEAEAQNAGYSRSASCK